MRLSLTLVLLFMLSSRVFANCETDANNLLQNANCDFSSDISNWTADAGMMSFFAGDDYQANSPGSILVDSAADGMVTLGRIISRCLSMTLTEKKTIGIWVKGNSGLENTCFYTLRYYSTSDCSTSTIAPRSEGTGGFQVNSTTDWTLLSRNVSKQTSLNSIQVELACANGGSTGLSQGAFSFKADNAFIVPVGTTLPVSLQKFSIE